VIADASNNRVRVVAARADALHGQAMTPGDIHTVAGTGTFRFSRDGGSARQAELSSPLSVTVPGPGHLVIGDRSNQQVRLVKG